jgi:hypothetical protein
MSGGVFVQNTGEGNQAGKVRKSQVYMAAAIVAILLLIGSLYVYMQHVASQRAALHKHSFMEYVATNHLGSLMTIDSGTGLDPMSYVMTLDHTLPDDQRQSFALDMGHRYYEYDHGQTLTIVYVDPKTHKQFPLAESQFDRFTEKLTLSVTKQSGQTQQVVQQVNW